MRNITKAFLDQVAYYDKIEDQLTLTTIHQSKGLEWPIVIIAHLNEGYLPSKKKNFSNFLILKNSTPEYESLISVEEERRLCYVAITRAEKILVLSSILNDRMFPSKFLEDIPEQLLQEEKNIKNYKDIITLPFCQTKFSLQNETDKFSKTENNSPYLKSILENNSSKRKREVNNIEYGNKMRKIDPQLTEK